MMDANEEEESNDHQQEEQEAPEPPSRPTMRQTQIVKEIMGKVVATKSAINYASQNALFALYCFDNEDELRDDLLEPWFVQRLEAMEKPSEMKKYAQDCLLVCSAEDNNCPFILSNLTFPHFSNFLSTRTSRKGKNKGKPNSLSVASYDQAKSALVHLFRMSKYCIPGEFAENLRIFMKGMKRHVATKKMEDGDSGIVGKKKMDFRVYEKICELFMKEEGEEYLFARCFLTLEWNLMARSESIVHAHFFHITWEDDCLAFRFAKSKTDQTGRNSDQVWHVYATPEKPATCPVLALATYVFANPGLTNVENSFGERIGEDDADGRNPSGGRLFPGGDQYGRFMDCLRRIIEHHEDVFLPLGVRPGDLGSHSARKGACSFAAAGSTVCPPMVSICLRAMWSMGSVKERYLQFEKAGDQYLGRVVSGLDVNSLSFAVSPPYFELPSDNKENKDEILAVVKDFTVGGRHGMINGEIFQLLYFCFASLCYHFDFLMQVLPKRNKLQASPFFTSIPNFAKEAATVRFPWNKTGSTPSFTGIPPHVSILVQIEGLKSSLEETSDKIISGVKADLDGRRLGSQSYFDKEEIIAKIGELHVELMRKVDAVSRRSSITALQQRMDECAGVEITLGGAAGSLGSVVSSLSSCEAITLVDENDGKKFQFFYSSGSVGRVPPDFVFPKMSLMTLITSWYAGNEGMKMVPLKLLQAREIKNKKERYKLSKMKKLMLAVEIAAKRVGTWDALSRRGAWSVGSTVRLFESVNHFFRYPSTGARRNETISWQTVFNLFEKHGRVFAIDLD